MKIHLLKFANYYNRKIRRYETAQEYFGENDENYLFTTSATNFNPRDGVETSHQFNFPDDVTETPNYALVCDNDGNIVSRWWVMEAEFTAGTQYRISLYRDVVAEELRTIVSAPAFIEKATIKDMTDPAIFNRENMTFNQIKTSEHLLKDDTNVPWIVGYVDNKMTENVTVTTPSGVSARKTYVNLPQSSYDVYSKIVLSADITTNGGPYIVGRTKAKWSNTPAIELAEVSGSSSALQWRTNSDLRTHLLVNVLPSGSSSSLFSYVATEAEVVSYESVSDLVDLNGDIIYISGEAKYYRVSMDVSFGLRKEYTDGGYFSTNMKKLFPITRSGVSYYSGEYTSEIEYATYTFSFAEINSRSASVTIKKASERKRLEDAPYSMFCIPAQDYEINSVKVDGSLMLYLASEIAKDIGSFCYDIQLLPYCPLAIGEDVTLDIDGNISTLPTETTKYSEITSSGTTVGYLFWCSKSKGSFDIEHTISVTDPKMQNETDMWRICAPDYSSSFEFNAAKNGGVTRFNVDWTYRPINPYIHINPDFGVLYGRDFDDPRGLVFAGDRSLPTVTDAWIEYQNNNKTYQMAFDRQIDNLEFTQRQERISAYFGAVSGASSGAMTGAFTGAQIGSAPGAVIGAVAGGAMSAAGGIADIAMLKNRQAETLDYAKDMFGFSLQNIQAKPSTVAKVAAFSKNDKIFPFIEYYTCTEEEKQALRDKMRWNGMTIGRIGKIEDYISNEETYIQARLIRIDGIAEDYHYLTVIGEEIMKGVFISANSESI